MLYSHNGSYPSVLPNRIRLSNGMTRTDSSTFTEQEIADAGYAETTDAPIAVFPNKVEWTGTDWVELAPSTQDIELEWQTIRATRNQLLAKSDVDVLKCYETGVPVPASIVSYRQELRDLPQVQLDPYNIAWPEAVRLDDLL